MPLDGRPARRTSAAPWSTCWRRGSRLSCRFLASIPASPPGPVHPYDDVALPAAPEFASPGKYALRVGGDSLFDLGVYDGEFVTVDPDQPVREGDLVAAVVPGDEALATLKLFVCRDDDGRWLVSGIQQVVALPIEENLRLGRVTSLHRRF
jgi:Peptidase S24-like